MAEPTVDPKPDPMLDRLRAWSRDRLNGGRLARHDLAPVFDDLVAKLAAKVNDHPGTGPDVIVAAWLTQDVAGSAVARDTLAWNELHGELASLKAALPPAADKKES